MSYSAIKIANYFIKRSEFSARPMKVFALVYIAHGWCLALSDDKLIDNIVEAWSFGPAVRILWAEFSSYGGTPISKIGKEPYGDDCLSKDHLALLDKIWKEYGWMTSIQLSNLNHQKGSPWSIVWEDKDFQIRSWKIENELIKDYFKLKEAK